MAGTISTVKGINWPDVPWRWITAASNWLVWLDCAQNVGMDRFAVLCGFTCRQSANPFETKEHCDPSSNRMFASTLVPRDDTVATAVFSKQTPLLATWYWPDVVTGWMVDELDGVLALVVVVVCLVVVVSFVSLYKLVWCLRWHLLQWCLDVQALTKTVEAQFMLYYEILVGLTGGYKTTSWRQVRSLAVNTCVLHCYIGLRQRGGYFASLHIECSCVTGVVGGADFCFKYSNLLADGISEVC